MDELLMQARFAELDDARAELDHWEYYADNADFVAEAGGIEAYNVELSKRFNAFYELNCIAA